MSSTNFTLATFRSDPPLPLKNAKNYQKRRKLEYFLSRFACSWLQLFSQRLQVELDELYKFHSCDFSIRPPLAPEKCQKLSKTTKTWVFPFPIRLWLTPTLLTKTPSRTRQALQILLLRLFDQTPPCPWKMPKTVKNDENLSISFPDSSMNRLQLYSHWFQIELDKLYRFHTLFINFECIIVKKKGN
jgi:hypothetical protein